MKSRVILKYYLNSMYNIKITEESFVTFLGNGNKNLINYLMYTDKLGTLTICDKKINNENLYDSRKDICFVLNKNLEIYNGETVQDEISFGLEGLGIIKNDMLEIIQMETQRFGINDLLIRDPNSLGSSDKAILKILNAICIKPKIIVLDNILCELDKIDEKKVVNILHEFVKDGGVVLNFTSDIEESLYGEKVILLDEDKILVEGKTLSVLNEEKIMKRLGLGLPFIVELNKYFMDYNLIKKYELDPKKLVNKLWK